MACYEKKTVAIKIIFKLFDGFRYRLHCNDGLMVVAKNTFVQGAKIYVDSNENGTEILFSSDEWINEGTGLSVIISINETSEPENLTDPKNSGDN